MKEPKAKNYPHLREITELDHCNPPNKGDASNNDNESIQLSWTGQSYENSEEAAPLNKPRHRGHTRVTDNMCYIAIFTRVCRELTGARRSPLSPATSRPFLLTDASKAGLPFLPLMPPLPSSLILCVVEIVIGIN